VFLQFFGGALFAQAYGLIANGRPGPMVLVATLAAACGLLAGAVPFVLRARNHVPRASRGP
jgi:ABC-type uncharacterized transport system permease subunit